MVNVRELDISIQCKDEYKVEVNEDYTNYIVDMKFKNLNKLIIQYNYINGTNLKFDQFIHEDMKDENQTYTK